MAVALILILIQSSVSRVKARLVLMVSIMILMDRWIARTRIAAKTIHAGRIEVKKWGR
jgi:hypothetical protein